MPNKTYDPSLDTVMALRQGEYEVFVDGKMHGTWSSLGAAKAGLQVEQRRAAARHAKAQA